MYFYYLVGLDFNHLYQRKLFHQTKLSGFKNLYLNKYSSKSANVFWNRILNHCVLRDFLYIRLSKCFISLLHAEKKNMYEYIITLVNLHVFTFPTI